MRNLGENAVYREEKDNMIAARDVLSVAGSFVFQRDEQCVIFPRRLQFPVR